MASTEELVRLGHYVVSRRVALGYKTRVDLAKDAAINERTLSDIEHGIRKAGMASYATLENTLHWKPGSIAETLRGGEPTPLEAQSQDGNVALQLAEMASLLADKANELRQIGQQITLEREEAQGRDPIRAPKRGRVRVKPYADPDSPPI